MRNPVKQLLRRAYWRYAHEGDPWQARLTVHALGKVALDPAILHPRGADGQPDPEHGDPANPVCVPLTGGLTQVLRWVP